MTATIEAQPGAQETTPAPPFAAAPTAPGVFKPSPPTRKPDAKPARNPAAQSRPGESQSPATPERVPNAGIVRLHNEETIAAVPLYSYAERSTWYGPNGQGGYSKLSDSQAKSLVAEYGFNKVAKDGQGNTAAERAMLYLIQNRAVAFAGALAGYPAGSHTVEGTRILVTEVPRLITPQAGHCPTIRQLIETMFADEEHPQADYFYLWAAEAFAAFWQRMVNPPPWSFRHCPVLAVFGPRLCGKSALIEFVLAPLFGGRKADPMNYLREPKFNKDLFAASLLVLDDKGAAGNLAERRQRGEGIKDLIWKPEQRMEGKGADALTLRPFWRMVIAGNDDDAGLQICPALSPSLEDKLLILRAKPAEGLPQTQEEREAWTANLRSELPAFAAYLLTWRAPDGLPLDPRTRVVKFQHPALVSALRDLQPETHLLDLIYELDLIGGDAPLWEGTASEFERTMRGKDGEGVLDKVFTSGTTAGRMLSELARIHPELVKKTDRDGRSHYRVFRRK